MIALLVGPLLVCHWVRIDVHRDTVRTAQICAPAATWARPDHRWLDSLLVPLHAVHPVGART